MLNLNLESFSARTIMTVAATGGWLTLTSAIHNHRKSSFIMAFVTLCLVPWVAALAPKLDKVLPSPTEQNRKQVNGGLTTVIEFILYSVFIGLVTYQSVMLANNRAIWYGVPSSLTIGIIPQIASLWNRLYSILLSSLIYFLTLYFLGKPEYFIEKDILFYYVLVAVPAFSHKGAEMLLTFEVRSLTILRAGVSKLSALLNWLVDRVHAGILAISKNSKDGPK